MEGTNLNDYSQIQALQKAGFNGYLYSMLAILTFYIVVGWPVVLIYPVNLFAGILFLLHAAAALASRMINYPHLKEMYPSFIIGSAIAACPIVVLCHLIGVYTVYCWFIVLPFGIYVLFPDKRSIYISILFGFLSLICIACAEAFHDIITEDIKTLMPRQGPIKISVLSPIIFSSALLYYFLYLIHRLHQTELHLTRQRNGGQPDPAGKDAAAQTEEKYLELYTQLQELFKTEKPYLNPDLTITELSLALNTNASYLSKAIAVNCGMNFSLFVNSYRINKIKDMIRNNNNRYTMEHIYSTSGFKYQSTFNKVFKQMEGITPSEYYKRYTPS